MIIVKKATASCLIFFMLCFSTGCSTKPTDANKDVVYRSGRDVNVIVKPQEPNPVWKGIGNILSTVAILGLLGGLVAISSAQEEEKTSR